MITVRSGRFSAHYSVHKQRPTDPGGLFLPLKDYRQEDCYCCGYMAALTVARYFDPRVGDRDVLEAVRTRAGLGTSQWNMLSGLAALGITARYRDDLDASALRAYVSIGVPVVVSVWPDGWAGDHWTVVRGFRKTRVYLTNHYTLTNREFEREWIENWEDGDYGAGLVCTRG